ncbi:MAG: hypothetical protein ACT4RN_18795 [Pseudonocardia sp.]
MPPLPARILVASKLGTVIEDHLRRLAAPDAVTIAGDEPQVRAAITGNLRFDVVLTDVTWNDAEVELAFDGLDVLDLLHRLGRAAPVLFAAQGHGLERDHLDEAAGRDGVAGIVRKAAGLEDIVGVLRAVAAGQAPGAGVPTSSAPLHHYFADGRRGETTARMAGAIAARRASNHETLAAAARCSRHTAEKIVDKYLGPLILERKEHPADVPLTVQSVYRWCGEHATYLVSWCRRNGHRDVLGLETV